jgi:hypothetical protein
MERKTMKRVWERMLALTKKSLIILDIALYIQLFGGK